MSDRVRRGERILCAAVAGAFVAFWLIAIAVNDPPEFKSQYVMQAIALVLVATPWVIAARLLWRAYWTRAEGRLESFDAPAWFLSTAVAALPEARREWASAMTAELACVEGRSARWRFALGCARAAIFPARSSPVTLLAFAAGTAAVAAVVTEFLGAGRAVPALRIFAATFAALLCALAILAASRSARARDLLPCPSAAVFGTALVAACIASTAYFVIEHPHAATHHLRPIAAASFAVLLAGYSWLALRPPRSLVTSGLGRALGAGGALALGLGFVLTSRAMFHTNAGPVVFVILAPSIVFLATSAAAAALARSFGAGVQAAVWTALAGGLLVFAIWLPEAVYRYGIDGRLLLDGEMGYAIDSNLGDVLWVLVAIPLLGLPFGVIGAALGRRWRGAPPNREELPRAHRS